MSAGLFRPEEFRDNCGFGLIAHTAGEASHRLLLTAIESLTCMTHRGGIAADGKTGDGCGLLMQMPDQFMRTVAQECFGAPLGEKYGVGQIFLSKDSSRASAARSATEKALTAWARRDPAPARIEHRPTGIVLASRTWLRHPHRRTHRPIITNGQCYR